MTSFLIILLISLSQTIAEGKTESPQDPFKSVELNKGVLFSNEGSFLLSADKWTISVDINLNQYHSAIQTFLQEISKIKDIRYRNSPNRTDTKMIDEVKTVMDSETDYLIADAIKTIKELKEIETTLTPDERPESKTIERKNQ